MRADRLIAILLLLQVHGQLTAAELAKRLETGERTVRRDMEALLSAGVPLYSQRGRGGGWALLGGHRMNLTGLTTDEAEALFMALAQSSVQPPGSEASPGLEAARRKVLAALPAPLREQAAVASKALLFDNTAWGAARRLPAAGQDRSGEAHLPVLRQAVLRRRQVVLVYEPPGRPPEERHAHPHGLVCKRGVWYLVAGTPDGQRTYRLSRVVSVRVTEEAASVPADFDLASAWAETEERLAGRAPSFVPVEVVIEPSRVRRLLAVVGNWWPVTEEGTDGQGRAKLVIGFPSARQAAVELLSLADDLEVTGPEEVRRAMVEAGRRLVERYGGGVPAPGG